jgi:hypothetical protein
MTLTPITDPNQRAVRVWLDCVSGIFKKSFPHLSVIEGDQRGEDSFSEQVK